MINSRANVSIENLLKLNNWINEGVRNKNTDKWVIELSIFNGWFIEIEFSLVSTSSRILHLMFSHYILNINLDKMLDSLDFRSKLEMEWGKFTEAYNDEKLVIDSELLFKLLWEFPKKQAIAKLVAGKIIEEAVLI